MLTWSNVIKRLRIHSFNEQNLIKTKIMWNQKKLILQCGCILMVINTINFVYFRNLSHCLISSAILFSSIVSRVVITVFHVYGSFFSCLQCSNTLVKSRIWLLYSASYASRMGTSICNCIPTWNHLTGLFWATWVISSCISGLWDRASDWSVMEHMGCCNTGMQQPFLLKMFFDTCCCKSFEKQLFTF